jgi:TRIAD3 protein (E3 ubiquitin-protein ligase RNF216)
MLVKNVLQVLADNNNTLFPAYLKLVQKEADEVWKPKKKPSKSNPDWGDDRIDNTIRSTPDEISKTVLEEFKVARQAGEALKLGLLSEKQREQDEMNNFSKAVAEGTTGDCECCCDEFALNRMVHCNGDTLHWFCRNCARLNAETQIGLSKFELSCMSMDGCTAGFSKDQKDIFLDEKTAIALERIEQEAALRLAGIENLETCPFCPYAAEYPPVEFDKEFRCERPDCEVVSCRLCRKETHIPKTCAEAALEEGHCGRRAIEEAMSAALIRKCNKCELSLSMFSCLDANPSRRYTFHQRERMQQDDMHTGWLSQRAVLRLQRVVRVLALQRSTPRRQDG